MLRAFVFVHGNTSTVVETVSILYSVGFVLCCRRCTVVVCVQGVVETWRNHKIYDRRGMMRSFFCCIDVQFYLFCLRIIPVYLRRFPPMAFYLYFDWKSRNDLVTKLSVKFTLCSDDDGVGGGSDSSTSNEGSYCEEHRNCWTKQVSFSDALVRPFVCWFIRSVISHVWSLCLILSNGNCWGLGICFSIVCAW